MVKNKELEMVSTEMSEVGKKVATSDFVKSSFEAVLHLHTEVIKSKEAELTQLKEENDFLKELILSIQDINSADRETIDILTKQLKELQDELEFTKRKYKLMWNKAVENYKK